MLMLADAASQGLVIGVASAIVAGLSLLMAGIYRMLGDVREDLRALRQTTEGGLGALNKQYSDLNRELGELKIRMEYVGAAVGEPRTPARSSAAPGRVSGPPDPS